MDCNEEDKTSDFFKAFLHSLRSSCFQFIDFRDHVSIRGFLAVDVDGYNQQHYVLSEIVSRGNNTGMTSFPLEVVTSSKSLDHELTSCHAKSPKNSVPLRETKNTNFSKTSRNKSPRQRFVQNTKAVGMNKSAKNCQSLLDSKPPRPYTFQSERSDPSNSTFVMERNIGSPTPKQGASSTTRGVECTPKSSISNTTVDVPRRSTPSQKRKSVSNNSVANNINTSYSKRIRNLTHNIRKKDEGPRRKMSLSRKRPHRTSSASSDSNYIISSSVESGSSCEDSASFRGRSTHKERQGKAAERHKRDRLEQQKNNVSTRSPSRGRGSPGGSFYSDKHRFDHFLANCEYDQDCSITSVKPRYLVGHSDDVNNINTGYLEPNNVNLILSKSTDSKMKNKLLLTEENIIKYIE